MRHVVSDKTDEMGKSLRADVQMFWKASDKSYTNVYPLDTLLRMKDSGLRIRVERELREQFLEACRAQDIPAAQVLREFMRDYVAEHPQDGQPSTRSASRVTTGNRDTK